MPEMHLRQPGIVYSACGSSSSKSKERMEKIRETGDSQYIYQNELGNACFQHDMAYGDFKNLSRRTVSEKVLCDNVFIMAENLKYGEHQCGLA